MEYTLLVQSFESSKFNCDKTNRYETMVTLTKKINGSYKSKLKSATPITIAITKAQSDMLKKGPRDALAALKAGKGSPQVWYTLTFRTEATRIIGELIYVQETANQLKEVRDVCLRLMEGYIANRKWEISDSEFELLEEGLDAADVLQDDNTRRVQLDAYKKADLYVKKRAKEAEDRLSQQEELA